MVNDEIVNGNDESRLYKHTVAYGQTGRLDNRYPFANWFSNSLFTGLSAFSAEGFGGSAHQYAHGFATYRTGVLHVSGIQSAECFWAVYGRILRYAIGI